jgi:hypothetical protein
MRIVLSRKGFDSAAGGVASPILPGGTLLSLPVPRGSKISYSEMTINGESYGKIVEDLTNARISGTQTAHLDPDLRAGTCPRLHGWRPIFGQRGSSQSHLSDSGVSLGDLFLFFGWFRQTEKVSGRYRFVRGTPDIHVFFGWLQIGDVVSVKKDRSKAPEWAHYHPHFHADYGDNNTVYLSSEKLVLDNLTRNISGAGAFDKYAENLCLTAPGTSRTLWQLPLWIYPQSGKKPLSYHSNMERWHNDGRHCLLKSAARGQEFVLDTKDYPEAVEWAGNLIMNAVL